MNRFKLHPLLLIYPSNKPEERRFVIETTASRPAVEILSPKVLTLISLLSPTFTKQKFLDVAKDIDIEEPTQIFSFFLQEGFILDETSSVVSRKSDFWKKFGWHEAYIYHSATKDYPFLKMNTRTGAQADTDRMRIYRNKNVPPDRYLQYENYLERFSLPKVQQKDDLNKILRELSNTDERDLKISMILDLCFGVRQEAFFPDQGIFLNKSVPSGGARHPTEAYLICFRHQNLPQGVYHYNVKKHSLDLIKSGDFFEEAKHSTYDLFKKFKHQPQTLLVITSKVERAMWRYRESRSWRAILIDAGFPLMLFRHLTETLGLKTYTYQKFKDSDLSRILGINRFSNVPLYVATIL